MGYPSQFWAIPHKLGTAARVQDRADHQHVIPDMKRTLACVGLILVLLAMAPDAPEKDATVGTSFRVPYRRTNTNHYLVRVRLNGKGPFNFLVDTGAPAMYIGTEAAKAIHLEPAKDSYWTSLDRLEIEGGAVLTNVKGRVEDVFQLTGMNALGLPGAKIDGILGFTILAKFRMEFDPTVDRLVWTRLDYNPKEPFVPKSFTNGELPLEMQAMNALGPMMKLMAVFVGKQPEDTLIPRGWLGIELLHESKGEVLIATVEPSSAAAKAGLKKGDRLLKLNGANVVSSRVAHEAVAKVKAGDKIPVTIRRDSQELYLDLTATEGL